MKVNTTKIRKSVSVPKFSPPSRRRSLTPRRGVLANSPPGSPSRRKILSAKRRRSLTPTERIRSASSRRSTPRARLPVDANDWEKEKSDSTLTFSNANVSPAIARKNSAPMRREDLWNTFGGGSSEDKSADEPRDYAWHQRSLRKLMPTLMKPPDVGEKFWVPKNEESVQNWIPSYETELQSFRSHDMLAQVKLEEVKKLTACNDMPNRMLSTLVAQVLVDIEPRLRRVMGAVCPALICCLQSAFVGVRGQNEDIFIHTIVSALMQAPEDKNAMPERPVTARMASNSPTRRVLSNSPTRGVLSPRTRRVSDRPCRRPSPALRIKLKQRPWSSPNPGRRRVTSASRSRTAKLKDNIRPMSSHSGKMRLLRQANATMTSGQDSMLRVRWQQQLTSTECYFNQFRALSIAETKGLSFQRRYKLELRALKQKQFLERKNLDGVVKRWAVSLKRITMQKWKRFVARQQCKRNLSGYMEKSTQLTTLSTFFNIWKRHYNKSLLYRQRRLEAQQRDQVIIQSRKLEKARNTVRKLTVAVQDQTTEFEDTKSRLQQKTEQLNHPAQNVQILSGIIRTCSSALTTASKLLTQDFLRISSELQGSGRESGSFLLFHQDDPHLCAYIRKSEANVRREWEQGLDLWPEYFPKEQTKLQSPRLTPKSLSYQSHVDVRKMLREFEPLRRPAQYTPSPSDTWDSWTEASGHTLQLWIQHNLWDAQRGGPVAEYRPEARQRAKLHDWQLQSELLHRVIPPTLVQHATSDEDVLLRQRRVFAEVQTLAPPMGRYISLCDPLPEEQHHWVNRAAVLHAYSAKSAEYVDEMVVREVNGEPREIKFRVDVAEPVHFAFLTELYCCHPGFTTQLEHATDMWNRMASEMLDAHLHTKKMAGLAATLGRRSVGASLAIADLNEQMRRIGMYFISHYTQWVRERYLWYVSCTNLMQASWHNAGLLLYSEPHLDGTDTTLAQSYSDPAATPGAPRDTQGDGISLDRPLFNEFISSVGVKDPGAKDVEYDRVVATLKRHENLLARVFSFYVALTPHKDTWCVSYPSYMRMLDDCKLMGATSKDHGAVSRVFLKQILPVGTTPGEMKRMHRIITDAELSFEQFLGALTMIAHEFYKFEQNEEPSYPVRADGGDKMKTVSPGRTAARLDGIILRFISRHATLLRVMDFQKTIKRDVGGQKILREHTPVLNAIFIWFSVGDASSDDAGKDMVLDYAAFEQMLDEAQMFEKYKFSRRMARSIFVCSVKASGFASFSPSADLMFPEFLDCLVAVALTFYPNPYEVLSRKIEALLNKHLYRGLAQTERYSNSLRSLLDKAGLMGKFFSQR